ncbi:MAG: 50S ribosomal protein L13 [Bdellovibrionales bacterium]|nr:50S ribosomal protein L13 [Bdellovibrionales bacterium]
MYMKTWNAKPGEIAQKWFLVDATDKTVGRLASEVAKILRGKTKPTFTPHVDTGDNVIVINSDKVKFTGKKWDEKKYYTHSRFFGSTKQTTAREYLENDSTQIVRFAVEGMLPKNRLGRKLKSKLKIYTGAEHPHSAQKPEALSLK